MEGMVVYQRYETSGEMEEIIPLTPKGNLVSFVFFF